jgi:RNAse (barnase) inhibitor barstar
MDIVWQDLRTAALASGAYRMKNRLPCTHKTETNCSLYRYSFPNLENLQRETLLYALAKTLSFPDYFGVNWDAAYDCLTDRDWQAGAVVVVEMNITADATVDEDALNTLIDVMRDACRFWNDQQVTLYFLLVCSRDDLASLNTVPILPFA